MMVRLCDLCGREYVKEFTVNIIVSDHLARREARYNGAADRFPGDESTFDKDGQIRVSMVVCQDCTVDFANEITHWKGVKTEMKNQIDRSLKEASK